MGKKRKKPNKQPTVRQLAAVAALVENGRGSSKGDALRAAGYSEAMATHPQRVFGTPVVRDILASVGVDEESTGRTLKRNINAKRIRSEYISRTNKTDDELREEFEAEGFKVSEILRYVNDDGKNIIQIRYWQPVYDISNYALDMAHKLLGAYAPTKVEGKHLVGTFSLKQLRKHMEGQQEDLP